MTLLVLGIVGRINSAEDQLDHPEVGSQIDGRLGASHFRGFVLVVGGAVDFGSDHGIVVELSKLLV